MKVSPRRRALTTTTSRRTLVTNGTLAALLLGGAAFAYAQLGTDEAAGETAPRTATAGRGSVTASVSASGSVESARSRALTFGTSGTVERVNIKAGDKVRKGDILAEVDDDAARETLSAAEAGLASATEDGTSTAQLYAAYVKARNAYRAARRAVDGTVIRAPFAGTVTAVNGGVGGSSSGTGSGQTQSGQSGQSGQSAQQGTSGTSGFVELADTRKLQLVGSFTESDAGRLKVGQSAAVTFDALPGVTATGKVSQIQPVASTSDNVVQYPVTITFGSVPAQVRLGQTATVEVVVGSADNAVTVPTAAISTSGGQSTVTVLRDGAQVRTPVEVGVRGTATSEITSGVSEGDVVVLPSVTTGTGTGNGQQQRGFGGGFPGGGPGGVPGGGR
ncbi:efflux RND transporter periplasmic adaptor subunit [Nonomuraea montanisoli]|uniref:efflux RND transporter periplasmic adaptor subunit n=1 Tax=Nonomuraea montanisoli TaxID=2741721 RepID=UPI002E2B6FFB|nr:biotin/lipoyl-binding protein [Nonomuraea montanisoli]